MKYPEKIPVKEPKDLTPPELKPFEIKPVEVVKPTPPEVSVSWLELLLGIFRKGNEHDLNELNRGNEPIFWPAFLSLVRQDWWKIAVLILVPILIWAGVRIFG